MDCIHSLIFVFKNVCIAINVDSLFSEISFLVFLFSVRQSETIETGLSWFEVKYFGLFVCCFDAHNKKGTCEFCSRLPLVAASWNQYTMDWSYLFKQILLLLSHFIIIISCYFDWLVVWEAHFHNSIFFFVFCFLKIFFLDFNSLLYNIRSGWELKCATPIAIALTKHRK